MSSKVFDEMLRNLAKTQLGIVLEYFRLDAIVIWRTQLGIVFEQFR